MTLIRPYIPIEPGLISSHVHEPSHKASMGTPHAQAPCPKAAQQPFGVWRLSHLCVVTPAGGLEREMPSSSPWSGNGNRAQSARPAQRRAQPPDYLTAGGRGSTASCARGGQGGRALAFVVQARHSGQLQKGQHRRHEEQRATQGDAADLRAGEHDDGSVFGPTECTTMVVTPRVPQGRSRPAGPHSHAPGNAKAFHGAGLPAVWDGTGYGALAPGPEKPIAQAAISPPTTTATATAPSPGRCRARTAPQ